MNHGYTRRKDQLAFLDTHTSLPAFAEVALSVAVTVTQWTERRKMRQALKTLPPHLLNDIGVSETQAEMETDKPFWVD